MVLPNQTYGLNLGFVLECPCMRSKAWPSPSLSIQAATHYEGYSRFIATDIVQGVQTTKSKRPLTIEEMKHLTSRSVALMNAGCTHASFLMACNPMGLSGSTASIQLNSQSWEDDSLGVQFCRLKMGAVQHAEALPYEHIEAQLVRGACIEFVPGNAPYNGPRAARLCPAINPGDNIDRSFAKLVHALVALYGVDRLRNVATHAIRKGAVTFATSGCTTGQSIGILTTRAGWSLHTVRPFAVAFHCAAKTRSRPVKPHMERERVILNLIANP
ncbi:hypothetical protein H257_17400, partial [Aphanomyces astaci]